MTKGNEKLPKIAELGHGEQPRLKPYLLVECVVGTVGTHATRHSDGLTERISPDQLETLLPMFVERAKRHHYKAVYVRGAGGTRRKS